MGVQRLIILMIYVQMTKQKEVDMEVERQQSEDKKAEEYEKKLQAEVARIQSEYQKQHAKLTQEIYEDVSKTLKDENKRR